MDLDQFYDAHVESLVRVLALPDIETEALTRRVAKIVQELARIWGIPADEIVHIRRGALLHDIGKVGVPDHILRKHIPVLATGSSVQIDGVKQFFCDTSGLILTSEPNLTPLYQTHSISLPSYLFQHHARQNEH